MQWILECLCIFELGFSPDICPGVGLLGYMVAGGGLVAKLCPTLAYPLSIGFSRQEYWSGLPFPSPGVLPDPEIEPRSPASQADSLPTELWGSPAIFSF